MHFIRAKHRVVENDIERYSKKVRIGQDDLISNIYKMKTYLVTTPIAVC